MTTHRGQQHRAALPATLPAALLIDHRGPRKERIEQQLRKEISEIMRREMNDPVLSYVSIMHVDVARDYHHAKVLISVIGDEHRHPATRTLRRAEGYIRALLGQRLENMKGIPHLTFEIDRSIAYSVSMSQRLTELTDKIVDAPPAEDTTNAAQ